MQDNFLTTKDFWEITQGDVNLSLNENNLIIDWVDELLLTMHGGSVFEIGCYPGKYLVPFARHGYQVSGIDYLDNTNLIATFFKEKGISTGKFYEGDFFTTPINEIFDVVTSFGFIEHFKDYQKVIEMQAKLVRPGGSIIIEVPNFKGFFQRIPRFLFDYSNFKKHNLKAMDPDKWISILERLGFDNFELKYWESYNVWYEKKRSKGVTLFLRNSLQIIMYKLIKILNVKKVKAYSPYIFLIAKKNK